MDSFGPSVPVQLVRNESGSWIRELVSHSCDRNVGGVGLKVKVNYFMENGKWKYSAVFESTSPAMWEVAEEFKELRSQKKLPGLQSGNWEGYILLDSEEGYPMLIHPVEPEALSLLKRVRSGEAVERGGIGAVNYPASPLLQEIHEYIKRQEKSQ